MTSADRKLTMVTMAAEAKAAPEEMLAAFVADSASEKALRQCLADLSIPYGSIQRGGIEAAIAHYEQASSPAALIVDITGAEPAASRIAQLAEFCEPGVSVLAIGDRNDIGLYRDLIRAGVQEYIVKPLPRDMLHDAVSNLLGLSDVVEGPVTQRLGKLVTVVGTRGGIGTSTVATNLAWGLANKQHRRVALVDLDLLSGACGLMLGVNEVGGLREALERPERVDKLFLQRAMIQCGKGLSLLTCDDGFANPLKVDPHALTQLVSILRKSHHYVVLDVPRNHGAILSQALELASTRVVVVDQTVMSIRDMLGLRPLVDQLRDNQKNVIVLNRFGERGKDGIGLKEVETTLGLTIDAVVPFDAKNVVSSANAGIPVLAGPGSVAKALTSVIEALSGTMPPPPRRSWFRRLLGLPAAQASRPQKRTA